MKLYFACLLFLLSFIASYSQSKETKDTTKTVVFTEVIKVDSLSRFELYKKAAKWAEAQGFEIEEEDPLNCVIKAKNQFIVYTDKGVLAKPNGDFTHKVLIEIKDGKYRYTFSDFVYRYYKQDRNLKYVPVKGSKPIEDSSAPGWKKQWTRNKMQVNNKINTYITSLREAMKYVAPKPVKNQKPKEEW